MKKLIGTFLLTTAVLLPSSSAFAASPFSDVENTKYAWAADAVRFMMEKGAVNGYGDAFRPDKTITKAEFVHMFHKLFPEIDYSKGKISEFADARRHWAHNDFAAVFNGEYVWPFAEKVGGIYPNYQFYIQPNKPLTRWDVMMIASIKTDRANQTLHPELQEIVNAAAQYKDIKVRPSSYYDNFSAYYPVLYINKTAAGYEYDGDSQGMKAEAFYTLTRMGVMTADHGYLRPAALVTRAEAVTILQRLYEAKAQ
ncbi:S-layer homology domain-containing protein [Paenibacillus sp. JX-17]|uniref:S-layer homology domain-containing protein n=1 Tax=Paenibacillus lacisoli TaxID=3064525 RepID=A0ABT9C6E3_9BACL|nr:S-layer homology domain-containing protein [Paenibacillus sp. JX-17]MDO7904833.1 S-layer homology domain-containing protein [Paenibacillus sp. JX-17]